MHKVLYYGAVAIVLALLALVADARYSGEDSVLADIANIGAQPYEPSYSQGQEPETIEVVEAPWSSRTHEVSDGEVAAFMNPTPVMMIVNEDGSCAGVVYEGSRYDGDCSQAEGLPEIAFYDFFTPDSGRFPD
jgi:ABC-type cobalt transport system substrate-binding protein